MRARRKGKGKEQLIGSNARVCGFFVCLNNGPKGVFFKLQAPSVRGRPKLICGSRVSSFGVLFGLRHVSNLDLGAWHRNLDASLRVEVATPNNRVLRIEFSNVHQNRRQQPPNADNTMGFPQRTADVDCSSNTAIKQFNDGGYNGIRYAHTR